MLNCHFGHLFIPALKLSRPQSLWPFLYEVRLSSSEEPLGRVDSKLFSVLNLGPAKEEVHNLLFRILNSLKRVLTDPLFQLAVSPRGTTLSWQHMRITHFVFDKEYDLELFTTLYLSSLLR